jgi:hypothetical protein
MSSSFPHFMDAQGFLGSGDEGEAARDGWPPRGQETFGALDPGTGSKAIVHTAKCRISCVLARNGWQGIRCLLQVCSLGKADTDVASHDFSFWTRNGHAAWAGPAASYHQPRCN